MKKKPFILGAIFARGGSKGIPRKNIYPLNGKPLIAYAIKTGLAVSAIDDLIVSTDDKKIAGAARRFGARVPFMRPKILATDHSPEILSWKHAVKEYRKVTGRNADILVTIPTTSPLRNAGDVAGCLQKLLSNKADVVITVSEAQRNPYYNMVTMDKKGSVRIASVAKKNLDRRQEAPKVYDVTTVAYAVRVPFLMKAGSLFDGKVKAVVVPRERALDIDSKLDLKLAEFFLKKRKRQRS